MPPKYQDLGAAGMSGWAVTGGGCFQRGDEVAQVQLQLAVPAQDVIESVRGDAAVGHVGRLVDGQDGLLVAAFQQVAQAIDDDLVAPVLPRYSRVTVSSTLRRRRMTSHQLSPPGGRK